VGIHPPNVRLTFWGVIEFVLVNQLAMLSLSFFLIEKFSWQWLWLVQNTKSTLAFRLIQYSWAFSYWSCADNLIARTDPLSFWPLFYVICLIDQWLPMIVFIFLVFMNFVLLMKRSSRINSQNYALSSQ
jgi:hypothetical protein